MNFQDHYYWTRNSSTMFKPMVHALSKRGHAGVDPDIRNIRTGECQNSWPEIVCCKQRTSQYLQRLFSYMKTVYKILSRGFHQLFIFKSVDSQCSEGIPVVINYGEPIISGDKFSYACYDLHMNYTNWLGIFFQKEYHFPKHIKCMTCFLIVTTEQNIILRGF